MFDIKNSFDFFLRNKIKISRKNYIEYNESKDNLDFNDYETELESKLLKKYYLEEYKNNSTIANYCQNLYLINIFDKYFNIQQKNNLSVLDIGSKNWYYAQAEYNYFKANCETLNLDGVELDSYRLYSNFYNRLEVAKYHIKNLEGANYIPNDVRNITKSYDYIVWILPFVLIHPLKRWGLPDRYFKPQELFNHAYSLLNNNGKMLIINQTQEEYKAQQKLLNGSNVFSTKLESTFYQYTYDRYLTIVEKN